MKTSFNIESEVGVKRYVQVVLILLLCFWLGARAYFGPSSIHTLAFSSAVVLVGSAFFVRFVIDLLLRPEPLSRPVVGREKLSIEEAHSRAQEAAIASSSQNLITWGGLPLALEEAVGHFFILGTSGSGKTLTFNSLMAEILPLCHQPKFRAIIYDVKTEILPFLHCLGLELGRDYVSINPFDERGIAWDVAKDITSPIDTENMARILIPENPKEREPHFTNVARQFVHGVLEIITRERPGNWDLADVLHVLRNQDRIKEVLSQSAAGEDLIRQHFGPRSGRNSVIATLDQNVARYQTLASLWSAASQKISLKDWAAGTSPEGGPLDLPPILILSRVKKYRVQLSAINRAMLQYLCNELISPLQPKTQEPRTFLFLDELREAGYIEDLPTFLNDGREYGVSVVMGTQSMEGLRKIYQQDEAQEITANCWNMGFYRQNSKDSAKWAQDTIGFQLLYEESYDQGHSVTRSRGGRVQSVTDQEGVKWGISDRPIVKDSVLMDLPKPTKVNGLKGFFFCKAFTGVWENVIPGAAFPSLPSDEDEEACPSLILRTPTAPDNPTPKPSSLGDSNPEQPKQNRKVVRKRLVRKRRKGKNDEA